MKTKCVECENRLNEKKNIKKIEEVLMLVFNMIITLVIGFIGFMTYGILFSAMSKATGNTRLLLSLSVMFVGIMCALISYAYFNLFFGVENGKGRKKQ